jgi:hypothetical protein
MGRRYRNDGAAVSQKPTREELIETVFRSDNRANALQCLVRDLAPSKGWHFTQTPRGFGAYLLHVDANDTVDVYTVHDKTRFDLQVMTANLYQRARDDDELESFLAASTFASRWRSTVFRTQRTKVDA